MKLRALFRRSHYKSDESFLNAVYRNNKTLIDDYLAGVGKESGTTPLKQFKFNVYETQQALKNKGKSISITNAMNIFTSSGHFIPEDKFYYVHFRENLTKGLRKFGGLKTLYKLTGHKFDPNMASYVGDNTYEYEGYSISFNNSPMSIQIMKGKGKNAKVIENVIKRDTFYIV